MHYYNKAYFNGAVKERQTKILKSDKNINYSTVDIIITYYKNAWNGSFY